MKILVFAGGNGTRLWPLSRIKTPKQFQPFIGDTSLFQLTIDRLCKRFTLEDIYVVVPEMYRATVHTLCPELDEKHIIIEPCKWDTLACIGYAAFLLYKQFPSEEVFLVWSDHVIKNEERFLDIVEDGQAYVRKSGKIIRIGAKATYPEVNWGYLKFGTQLDTIHHTSIYAFEGHHEKPELALAKKFVSSYEYLWNMGYMIWPLEKLIAAYKRYSPKSYTILKTITSLSFKRDIIQEYQKIEKNSIDFVILEKAKKSDFVVIPADVGWNDVGDWASLKAQLEKHESDIIFLGKHAPHYVLDSKDAIIYSVDEKKTICLVGMEDVAVIDTPDALLICKKKHSRDVKKIVETLAQKNTALC